MRGDRFAALVRAATRRPLLTVALVALLAAGSAVFALLRLEPSTSEETLADRDSATAKATERYRTQFGGDTVLVLVKGDLQRTVLTSDLGRLLSLEGCLSGNVPPDGLEELPAVCSEIAREKPARVVYGPGTFINTAANEILKGFEQRRASSADQGRRAAAAARQLARRQGRSKREQDRLAKAAESLAYAEFTRDALRLALRYGFTGLPALDNADFVSNLVFDPSRGPGAPKRRFAYLFPGKDAALVQVRLKPELSDEQRREAIALVERAAGERKFKPTRGARYIVTGVPVVAAALADEVQRATVILLIAALIIMTATLALVFRSRMRLLPLGLALAAAAITFGGLALVGGSLTMASIAALPILIGLAVDYAIQFQARFREEHDKGGGEPAVAAARVGGPTIAGAGLATAVGFLVLLLSPVPMVQGFGAVLVAGVVVALACALTAGSAALARWYDRTRPEDVPPPFPRLRERAARLGDTPPADALAAVGARLADWAQAAVDIALRFPRRVLVAGAVIALLGWAADTQTEVVSDVRDLVPRDLQALQDVNVLQESTNVSGEIDVMVTADDLTAPSVIRWMVEFQKGALCANGYEPKVNCEGGKAPPGRRRPELYPALSLPDLFRSTDVGKQEEVRALLDAVPPYFSQAVITDDRKTANLAFGIRLMPLERQKEVIDDLRARLDPPPGVTAELAGLPVLAAEANEQLASTTRRALTLLAGIAGVFLVLWLLRRRVRLAAVPLIPIALATGWSAALLFLLGIPLNPMSAGLGALVVAISTEFSVLLSARYHEERERGAPPRVALERTYRSTGAAVLASGVTAIAGFAALIASDITMLRDFGIVTVVNLTVSLLGVMIVLPAALIWAEQHGPFRVSDLDPRRLLRRAGGFRPRLVRPRLPWPRRSG